MKLAGGQFWNDGGNPCPGSAAPARPVVCRRLCQVLLGLLSLALPGGLVAAEPVTSLSAFYQLTPDQAAERRPVRLQMVVVCYDPGWGQLYFYDGKEVLWANHTEVTGPLTNRQKSEITGFTTIREGVTAFTNLQVRPLGLAASSPAAKPLKFAALNENLGQWVEGSGRVRTVDFSWGRTLLTVNDGAGSASVYIMGLMRTNEAARLLGSRIQFRGINSSKVESNRLVTASLFVPGMEDVKILEAGGPPPPAPPIVSIDALLSRKLGEWTNHPVRISGLVESYEAGNTLMVHDPTGLLRAQVRQLTQVLPEDRVELSGYFQVTPQGALLADAWFEVVKPPRPPVARRTSGESPAGDCIEPLASTEDIIKLGLEDAALGLPVRLQGVVLYADAEWRSGFLHDGHGAVFFDLNQGGVRPGQWVELTGKTSPGGFAPEVVDASVNILGETNFPTAAKLDLSDLADGHQDAQWIELEGVVRRAHLESGHWSLNLMTAKGRFNALLLANEKTALPTNLVGAVVSVRGACGSDLNARRQVRGITLHVSNGEQIKILTPAPADPFAGVATPVTSVATFDPGRAAGQGVKVEGVVTLILPDQGFYVQDNTGGLRVRSRETAQLQPGDVVEVLGFPTLGDFSPTLEEAIFQRNGRQALPPPHPATAEEILMLGAHDGEEIALEATLLQDVPAAANPQLLLQSGAIIFTARLSQATGDTSLAGLRSGSELRLQGICSIQEGERHEPKGFNVLLRSAQDVTLLNGPAWWTAQRVLWVLGGLTAVLALVLGWARSLRRQVQRQTRKLLAEIQERERVQQQVEKAHQQLVIASRQAGMAEVATNVLHNVGNVLNSVNVSVSVLGERVHASSADGVARVADLLEQNKNDLPQFFAAPGRVDQVLNYLRVTVQHLGRERTASLGELSDLGKNVEHIKEIVAMQQSYARIAGVTETIHIVELVEDALRMNQGALTRHDVKLVREYAPDLPSVTVDKHKVLQILVNVIRNAKYACDESGRLDKVMTVRLTRTADHLEIAVVDNGVGILPENLTRIFRHGFTTRKEGHGFGLHSGALAAKELGGALKVFSEGPHLGATFTLELPLAAKETVAMVSGELVAN